MSHQEREWRFEDIDLSKHLTGATTARIRFELESDKRQELGGWNVDDVSLVAWTPDAVPPAPEQNEEVAPLADPARPPEGGCACSPAPSPASPRHGGYLLLAALVPLRRLVTRLWAGRRG